MSAGMFGAYRTCFAIEIWVACCFTAVCHLLRRFCIRIFCTDISMHVIDGSIFDTP